MNAKVVLNTGALTGIGHATALAFAKEKTKTGQFFILTYLPKRHEASGRAVKR
jgi:NAD(P)-dependent dehydrogenase (short-subunit alcohol dehydrogenase family)